MLTRYSDVDLWEQYHEGPSKEVKDVLAISDQDISPLAKLKEGVLAVDKHMRKQKDEKAAKTAKMPAQPQWRPAVPAPVPSSATWHVQRAPAPPARDPNAMDVDTPANGLETASVLNGWLECATAATAAVRWATFNLGACMRNCSAPGAA
jgi:hypothetical protein